MSNYVLVHGALHGAWCWKKVIPFLVKEGHTVVAPDLPGLGQDKTPTTDVTLKAYTDRVCQVIDEQIDSVMLVGHSMGGIVITQVAEYRPEKIKMLVYLTALMPINGESGLQVTMELQDPNQVTLADDQSWFVYKDELVENLFYNDCSREDVSFAKSMLVPQATKPWFEPVCISDDRYGRIPRVFIECLKDNALPPPFQKKMYSAVPCERIISMDTSHSAFLSAPETLAKHLLSLA